MTSTVVSVSQAADMVRKDRQTLYNHRKQGKLSFVRREDDSFGVDTAELQRVYGKLYIVAAEESAKYNSAPDSDEIKRLRHELQLQELKLKHSEEKIEDLEQDRDEWRDRFDEARTSVKLLESKTADWKSDNDKRIAQERADQKQRAVEWESELQGEKLEKKQAQQELEDALRREQDQIEIKALYEKETNFQKRELEYLKNRGVLARLFNKKLEVV